jgi:hypothetical protein
MKIVKIMSAVWQAVATFAVLASGATLAWVHWVTDGIHAVFL